MPIKTAERNFAKFVNAKHCIIVSSGTAALHTAYLACGIGNGDEVVVPAFVYYATSNMILACGAKPIFADIETDYLIDIVNVKQLLTKRTKAVVVANLFGKEKDTNIIKAFHEFLKRKGIYMIIDSAQCTKPNVYQGDICCFSFYRTKQFSCFEGGAITTNNDKLAKECRIIMNQGEDKKYNVVRLGFNYRISDLQAVMLNHLIMYHRIGGKAELGRFSPKDGHYPKVVYEQPYYKQLGLYDKWYGNCPVAERIAREVRKKKNETKT